MRIAMITNNYKPFIGGVPISIERLAEGLREIGHEVYIFAPKYKNQEEEEYVIRYKSIKHSKNSHNYVIPNTFNKSIESVFKELDIDVIHVHHPIFSGKKGISLGKKYNIPVVFTYHTRYEQYLHNIKVYDFVEKSYEKNKDKKIAGVEKFLIDYTKETLVPKQIKKFANQCTLVFAPTKMISEHLKEVGIKKDIKILPTGLDSRYFKEDDKVSREIREKFIEDKKYLFCTVSRLSKEKNLTFLIKGLKSLKDKIGNCFNMIIIGDGTMRDELMELGKISGLEENIHFLKSVPNTVIGDYYRACDMFLFASKSETQGIVLIEGMAAKLPVVAVKATGVVDVVQDGINGYMTNEDIEEWSDRIKEIINNDSLMDNMKSMAVETAMQYLNSNIAKVAEKGYNHAIELNELERESQYEKRISFR